ESGFGKKSVDELLGDVEGQLAFGIGKLRTHNRGCVLGGLQAMLTFLAALKKVTDTRVELRVVVQVVCTELIGLENRDELRVPAQHRIGTQIGGDLLRLALQNRRTQGQQRVIMLQRQAQCLVQSNAGRGRRRLRRSSRVRRDRS